MPNIIETLDQTEFWYAQDGMPVRLAGMELRYMLNVRQFLLRRADSLYEHKQWQSRHEAAYGAPRLPQDPEQWLARTLFFRELESRIRRAESIEPDSLRIEENPCASDRGCA